MGMYRIEPSSECPGQVNLYESDKFVARFADESQATRFVSAVNGVVQKPGTRMYRAVVRVVRTDDVYVYLSATDLQEAQDILEEMTFECDSDLASTLVEEAATFDSDLSMSVEVGPVRDDSGDLTPCVVKYREEWIETNDEDANG